MLGVAMLLAGALSAPGEIYRCPHPDGGASFQDRPCAGTAGHKDRIAASADDPRALREWLAQYRHAMPRAAASTAVAPAPRNSSSPGPQRSTDVVRKPLDEHQLAVCSERFYVCADGDGTRMDNCVAHMAQCGSGAAACCPAQTLACYRGLRASGSTPAQAVRGALLGSEAAAFGCGP
jgi:hypothetical protein